MTPINNTLEQIKRFIPEGSLRHQLSKESLNNILYQNNLLGNDISELYESHDGSNYSINEEGYYSGIEFCSFGYLLTIEDALEIYNTDFLEFKQNRLFPIVADFAGDYLLINTTQKNSKVYIYSPALFITEPEVIFENLKSFFATIHECYKSSAYVVSNNKLNIDDDAELAICEKDKSYSIWSKGSE